MDHSDPFTNDYMTDEDENASESDHSSTHSDGDLSNNDNDSIAENDIDELYHDDEDGLSDQHPSSPIPSIHSDTPPAETRQVQQALFRSFRTFNAQAEAGIMLQGRIQALKVSRRKLQGYIRTQVRFLTQLNMRKQVLKWKTRELKARFEYTKALDKERTFKARLRRKRSL